MGGQQNVTGAKWMLSGKRMNTKSSMGLIRFMNLEKKEIAFSNRAAMRPVERLHPPPKSDTQLQ
ncbi:hypothetical protein [Roseibium sp.]|uniref:hypothetical protein n=1 Tax=Roseibium sp. TaxID=1936156 RepID=UPI00391B41ED